VVNGSLRGAKEQRSFKPQAEGSIPSGRTLCFAAAWLPGGSLALAADALAHHSPQRIRSSLQRFSTARSCPFGLNGQVSAYRHDVSIIGPNVNRSAKVDKLRKT
jgi:hypothetical protein